MGGYIPLTVASLAAVSHDYTTVKDESYGSLACIRGRLQPVGYEYSFTVSSLAAIPNDCKFAQDEACALPKMYSFDSGFIGRCEP